MSTVPQKVWVVIARCPLLGPFDTEDLKSPASTFNGWIVGTYSSFEKAEKQILEGHVGYSKVENVYVQKDGLGCAKLDEAILKILEYVIDDTNE